MAKLHPLDAALMETGQRGDQLLPASARYGRELGIFSLNHGGKTPLEAIRTTLIRKSDVFQRMEDGKFWLKGHIMLPLIPSLPKPPEIGVSQRPIMRYKRRGET